MVALRSSGIAAVDLAEAVGVQKKMDPQGEMALTARGLGISLGD